MNIIQNAQLRVNDSEKYYEKHHILPKSLWPEYSSLHKNKWNQVTLTAREHFICHMLLVRMTSGKDRNKMSYALWGMSNQKSKYQQDRNQATSLQYQSAKKLMQVALSLDRKGKSLIELYGSVRAADIKTTFKSRKHRGPLSDSEKAAHSNRMRVQHQTSPWKRALQLKPMARSRCVHCGLETNLGNLARYHNDKCKLSSPCILE